MKKRKGRENMPKMQIDAAAIPKGDINYLARGVLAEIGDYFERPEVKADYEKWLQERKKEAAMVV